MSAVARAASIKADRTLDFGAVREVLERARAAGAKGVGLVVVDSWD
jgi:biopolymer transport protein ExbD